MASTARPSSSPLRRAARPHADGRHGGTAAGPGRRPGHDTVSRPDGGGHRQPRHRCALQAHPAKGLSMQKVIEYWGADARGINSEFADMQAAGATWARVSLPYGAAGAAGMARVVSAARAHHVRLVVVLGKPGNQKDIGTAANRAAYRSWVTGTVRRFSVEREVLGGPERAEPALRLVDRQPPRQQPGGLRRGGAPLRDAARGRLPLHQGRRPHRRGPVRWAVRVDGGALPRGAADDQRVALLRRDVLPPVRPDTGARVGAVHRRSARGSTRAPRGPGSRSGSPRSATTPRGPTRAATSRTRRSRRATSPTRCAGSTPPRVARCSGTRCTGRTRPTPATGWRPRTRPRSPCAACPPSRPSAPSDRRAPAGPGVRRSRPG